MDVKDGDWVTTYSPGIWRIYRILKYKRPDPFFGKEMIQTTIFSKRFLSKSFKGLFGEACCHPSFVSALGLEDRQRLEAFIADKPGLYEKFESYHSKTRTDLTELRDLT